ncbi:MAG TPA: CvpA family protein, partial [Candidatus Limnocylindrales bacterium]
MNLVDVVIIGILIFALVAGLASGAFPQLGGLAGAIGGGALSILVLLPVAQSWLQTLDPPIRAIVVLVGIVGIVGLGEAIGSGIGSRIRERLVDHGFLGGLDRAAGGLLGLAQGVLVVWLVGGVLAAGPVPSIAAAVQRSAIVRGLAGVLPPPTEIVGELGKWLD